MNSKGHHGSRRNFIKGSGLGLAASLAASVPPGAIADGSETGDLDALAKQALDGSPVRLSDTQLHDLKREIESVEKSLAKVREFRLRSGAEPASVFRAR